MRATVEPLEGNKVKLSVEVDEAEFDKAVDAAFRRVAREVRVPGFRPGKVPRRLLEARLGTGTVRQEAMRESLPEYYAQALRQTDVDAIAPPEIDVTGGRESGPLAFDAVVEVRPQVSVPGYAGLRVTVPSPSVGDDEVDAQIDRLRQSFGELAVVGRPARDGDHLTIDIKATRHQEVISELTADDYLYELGSASLVDRLDEELRGARPGDIFKFNAAVPGVGEGEEATFQVLVKEVKEMVLPEATDEWASEASEFDTVDELRAELRRRLEATRQLQSSYALHGEVEKALVELVADDPPEALVSAELERRLQDLLRRLESQGATVDQYLSSTGQTQQQFVEELREVAVSGVKADLALRAVADAEGIEVTDDEVDAELKTLAARMETDPDALRAQLERAEQMPAVRSDIRKAKAMGWLLDHVEIVDDEGNPVSRDALSPKPPTAETDSADSDTVMEPATVTEGTETEA